MDLELIALDPAYARKIADGDFRAIENCELTAVASLVRAVAAAYHDLYARTAALAPWLGYLARDPQTTELVGSCEFKDVCREGVVEIAYFTFAQYEGRGWGGRMAAELVAVAMQSREVEIIRARPLNEENTSTAILRRLEFRRVGRVHDAEDGDVLR